MNEVHVAFYARVSSDQQTNAGTIGSQIAALKERIQADGFHAPPALEFVDEGFSGSTLIRPAMERLRDLAAAGAVDRLYVHSPDRLARNYAYQVLVLDELVRGGVEVVFLNQPMDRSPEGNLLIQVQGMFSEFERAKIIERCRRGKRFAARNGSVNILCCAPYGYQFISKHQNGGVSRMELVAEQAQVVSRIFEWVGQDRLSIGEVCRRLREQRIPSPKGKDWWDRTSVWGILRNPAYSGLAAFGKTQVGPIRARLHPVRGMTEHGGRPYSVYDRPKEEWSQIPVPAIVSSELFDAVQAQLGENRQQARLRSRGAQYLLQGLVICKQCGYAYYGKPVSRSSAKGRTRRYAYYRCTGTDGYRFGGERVCTNKEVRTDLLESAVWGSVKALLEEPERLEAEYTRRLQGSKAKGKDLLERIRAQVSKLRKALSRLIDGYSEGWIEKEEFEPRIKDVVSAHAFLESFAHAC